MDIIMNSLLKFILNCLKPDKPQQETTESRNYYQETPPIAEEFSFGSPTDQKSLPDELSETVPSKPSIS